MLNLKIKNFKYLISKGKINVHTDKISATQLNELFAFKKILIIYPYPCNL